MAQWTGKRAIIKKYQISRKELLHIIRKGEVAYSDVDGVLLVDEESFAAYIEALKQMRQKNNVVNRLEQALHSRKSLSLDKTETSIALRLENRVSSIYAVTTHALSMLLDPREERAIFLAFANGDSLQSIARQMRMKRGTVIRIFENSLARLDKQAPYIIQRLVGRCLAAEEANHDLANKITECKKVVLDGECEILKLKVRIDYLRRREEELESHLEEVRSMFKKEREVNAGLEELVAIYNKDDMAEFFSSVKTVVGRFFHFFRG